MANRRTLSKMINPCRKNSFYRYLIKEISFLYHRVSIKHFIAERQLHSPIINQRHSKVLLGANSIRSATIWSSSHCWPRRGQLLKTRPSFKRLIITEIDLHSKFCLVSVYSFTSYVISFRCAVSAGPLTRC